MKPFVRLVFCVTILFALGLRGYGLWVNSPVQSEDAHLASGVAHWLFERFDLYKVNPPLVRVVAAIPVAGRFSKDNDWYRYDASPHARSEFVLGIDVVRDRDDRMSLLIRSRLFTCVVFGVVGLCFLWKFSESAFDVGAGFVALGLWSSNPYVLGHGATIMPDVPSAELAVAAVYCFWQWLRQPDFGNAFLSGVVLGSPNLRNSRFSFFIRCLSCSGSFTVCRNGSRRFEISSAVRFCSSAFCSPSVCSWSIWGTFSKGPANLSARSNFKRRY